MTYRDIFTDSRWGTARSGPTVASVRRRSVAFASAILRRIAFGFAIIAGLAAIAILTIGGIVAAVGFILLVLLCFITGIIG